MAIVTTRYGRLHIGGWLFFEKTGEPYDRDWHEGLLGRVLGRVPVGRVPKGTRPVGGQSTVEPPLTHPVDQLLALASPDPADAERAVASLLGSYYLTGLVSQPYIAEPDQFHDEGHELRAFHALRRRVQKWQNDGIPELFLRASRRLIDGNFTPELGPHLARIRFHIADGFDEVHDVLALGAWCADQAMRTGGPYEIKRCELCLLPFLSTERARYCQRLAPRVKPIRLVRTGDELLARLSTLQRGQSCQQLGKVRDYRRRQRSESSTPKPKATRA